MNELYRGYVKLKGKASVEKFKGVPSKQLRTLEEAQKCDEYGGVLAKNTMFIDIDDERVIIRTKLEKPSKIKGLALI